MRRAKKTLALSFVLTFAACKQAPSPQAPVDASGGNANPATTDATPSPAKDYDASADAAPRLPKAPAAGKLTRRDDGSCWWEPPPCNGAFPCNPPAPHAVECPPDAP